MLAVLPVVGGEAGWNLWVPGLAQNTLMMLVLKGEALTLEKLAPQLIVGTLLTIMALLFVARSMRSAVSR